MPYKEHPELKIPDNPDAKIWRYLDFTKFLSMLEDQSLYFCRLDVLAKNDPYEGLYTNFNARSEDIGYSELPEEVWKQQNIKNENEFSMIQNMQIRANLSNNRGK